MEIEPGIYEATITIENEGKIAKGAVSDRDRFQLDELERYEVYLQKLCSR